MAAHLKISAVKRYPEPGEVLLSLTVSNEGSVRIARGVLVGTVIRTGHDNMQATTLNSTELAPAQYIKLFVSFPEGASEGRDFVYIQDDGIEIPVSGTVRKRLLGWAIA